MPKHELRAPKGLFRVIGVDTFEDLIDGDYWIGDYANEEQALAVAKRHGGEMNPVYVYDDQGTRIAAFGSA